MAPPVAESDYLNISNGISPDLATYIYPLDEQNEQSHNLDNDIECVGSKLLDATGNSGTDPSIGPTKDAQLYMQKSRCESIRRAGSCSSLAVRRHALDGGWGWMIVVACCLGHFVLPGLARSIGVFFLPWQHKFDSSAASISWIQALFTTSRMLTAPPVSMLCERIGCRRVVFIGGILYAAGNLISAFATSTLYLTLSFGLLSGCGGGFILAPMFIILNQYFDKKKGIAMALSTMGTGLGSLTLAPVFALCMNNYGHFGTMIMMTGIALNTFIVASLFRPGKSRLNKGATDNKVIFHIRDLNGRSESIKENKTHQIKEGENDSESPQCTIHPTEASLPLQDDLENNDVEDQKQLTKWSKFKSNFLILNNVTFWIYSFYMSALPCAIMIFSFFAPGLMNENGISDVNSALVLSVGGIADTIGRLVTGVIFDSKYIRTRRWPTHCCYGFLAGLAVFVTAFQTTLPGFITVAVFWGLTESGYHSQRATIVTEFIKREHVAKSVGFMLFWQGVGGIISPTLAGYLKDQFKTFRVCFYYGGATMMFWSFVFMVNFIVVHQRQRKQNV